MNSLILLGILVPILMSVTCVLIKLRLWYLDRSNHGVAEEGAAGAARERRRAAAIDFCFPNTTGAGGDTDDECEDEDDGNTNGNEIEIGAYGISSSLRKKTPLT